LRDTAMAGRTHGVHAEPTTFGAKLALWCLQADRDRARLRAAREAVAVGKVSGAVGTYSQIDPAVEQQVCAGLGIKPVPASQVVALWHERDISHSSVERVILPDSSLLAYYLLVKMQAIVEGMQVHPERMLENLDRSYGLVFSQPVLLALVAGGLNRDDAYRIVQEAARTAWAERRPLRDVLAADERVGLTGAQLDEAFSLERSL